MACLPPSPALVRTCLLRSLILVPASLPLHHPLMPLAHLLSLSVSHPLETHIWLIIPLLLAPLNLIAQDHPSHLPCLGIPLCMAHLPALPIIYALLSGALAHLVRSLLVLPHPSVLPRLSCSLRSLHAQDSLHAHSASCLSHTPRVLCLLLSPSPSPLAPCLSHQMGHTLPCLASLVSSLLPLSKLSCHDLRALLSLCLNAASSSQTSASPLSLPPNMFRGSWLGISDSDRRFTNHRLRCKIHDLSCIMYLASCILISLIFIRVHLINSWLITLKLSHQNHQKTWSPRADSNRRPHPYQGCALPSELRGPSSDRAGDGIRTRDPQLGRLML